MTNQRPYNDSLSGDVQISMEEHIAYRIFNEVRSANEVTEENCAELGRAILYDLLLKFRPDLFHTTVSECVEALRGCLKLIEDEGLDELHGDLAEVVRGVINDAEQD
jgi:hypothetical protein